MDGRAGWEVLGGVEGEETVFILYYMRLESVFNK